MMVTTFIPKQNQYQVCGYFKVPSQICLDQTCIKLCLRYCQKGEISSNMIPE